MDPWKLANQALMFKLMASNRLISPYQNSAVPSISGEILSKPTFYHSQGPFRPTMQNCMGSHLQVSGTPSISNFQSHPSLMNLLFENQLLKSQLQAIKPSDSQLSENEKSSQSSLRQNISTENTPIRVSKPNAEKSNEQTSESSTKQPKGKRYRRLAKQIHRTNSCPCSGCGKSYGSEGSLHQHMRLKHPEFDLLGWIRNKINDSKAEKSLPKNHGQQPQNIKPEEGSKVC